MIEGNFLGSSVAKKPPTNTRSKECKFDLKMRKSPKKMAASSINITKSMQKSAGYDHEIEGWTQMIFNFIHKT